MIFNGRIPWDIQTRYDYKQTPEEKGEEDFYLEEGEENDETQTEEDA